MKAKEVRTRPVREKRGNKLKALLTEQNTDLYRGVNLSAKVKNTKFLNLMAHFGP